ncbi:hypothetical protein SAMN05660691_01041 [Rheinheimera pacifica]|uniref:Uncharacterized protein n=1 Tax=Rheinheimera pacifica TaxID=173990 RepID=A0A1H6KAW3_9GAMM|nr:hypothetical protein [Rheinheimera pacifica]SEH72503.1 hypothetical protein SAMN05660691_01041 [Rheinheimera pacifica]
MPATFERRIPQKYITLNLDNVRLENMHLGRIPDLIVTSDGYEYFIEIAVTHFCDASKKAFYIKNKLSCIEINLSKLKNQTDLEPLIRRKLFEEPDGDNKWVSLNPLSKIGTQMVNELRAEVNKLNKDASDAESRLKTAANYYNSMVDKTAKLDYKLGKQRSDIKSLSLVGPAASQLRQIKEQVAEKNLQLNNIAEKLEAFSNDKAELLAYLYEIEGKEKELQIKLSMASEEREKLLAEIQEREHLLEARQQKAAEMLDYVNSIESKLARFGLSLENAQEVAELHSKKDLMEYSLQVKLQQNEELIKQRFNVESQKLSELQKKSDDLENRIKQQLGVLDFYKKEAVTAQRNNKN